VKEGYFKYIEIMFEWHKYMNPWQVRIPLSAGRYLPSETQLMSRKMQSRHYSMETPSLTLTTPCMWQVRMVSSFTSVSCPLSPMEYT
jgi:hypothetical protein